MEGMNIGAMYLIALGVLIDGLSLLVILALLLAGRFKLTRLALAAGLLTSAIIAALASLTYLMDVNQFAPRGAGLIFTTMAAVLLLAGVGQFRAAIFAPGRYFFSLTLSLASVGLLPLAIPIGDLFGAHAVAQLKFDARQVFMILTFSIGLGMAGLMVSLPSPGAEQELPAKGKPENEFGNDLP